MAAQDSAVGITTALITVGASLCVGLTAGPFVNSWTVNFISGGTCSIVGVSTLTVGYPILGTPVNLGGPTKFFINETGGVTSIVAIIKSLNSPSAFS